MRPQLTAAIACAALLACGPRSARERKPEVRERAQIGEDVVSSVDGAGIRAGEVERLAEDGHFPARAALDRLQAERLLEEEAERRGYAATEQTQHVTRQALVQQLLKRDVEREAVSEAEIDAAYERERSRFEIPEKRAATHLLAYLPKDASDAQQRAARAFAERACRELLRANDVPARLEALAHSAGSVAAKVEHLPPLPKQGGLVSAFADALFSLPAPGIVPEPVRTQFGYHVIVLDAIIPAVRTPLMAARATLRRELAQHKHERRLAALLQQLQARVPVEYEKRGEQALAALEL